MENGSPGPLAEASNLPVSVDEAPPFTTRLPENVETLAQRVSHFAILFKKYSIYCNYYLKLNQTFVLVWMNLKMQRMYRLQDQVIA